MSTVAKGTPSFDDSPMPYTLYIKTYKPPYQLPAWKCHLFSQITLDVSMETMDIYNFYFHLYCLNMHRCNVKIVSCEQGKLLKHC